MKIAFVLAASFLTSTVMAADAPAAAPAEPAKEKKICHNLEPALGSNMSRRTCKTREEWAKQGAQDQQTTGQKVDTEKFRDMTTQFAAPKPGA